MSFTSLWANDNWPTSRATINGNFVDAQAQLDTKVEYSGAVPAVWNMAVFATADGLEVKKKVFTASQVLVSDVDGSPDSEAKWTAFNKNFGTSAGTVLQWDNDALYMKLAGTQTVTGDKTFSWVTIVPTQSQGDSSTKAANTAFVQTEVGLASATNSPNLITTDTTGYMISGIPTAGAHWTYSGSPTYYFNGVKNTANGGATWYATIITDLWVTSDMKVKFVNKTVTTPSGTTSAWVWAFIGFLGQNPATGNDGDITNVASRVGFAYYNGNLYAVCADGSSVTSSLISTYSSTVVDRFQINYTTTSVTFYRNGALVATITTTIPSTQVRFGNSWNNGGGGGAGNVFSNIVFAQKRT